MSGPARGSALGACHPAVPFLFFAGAIGLGVILLHPACLAASLLGAALLYGLLRGRALLRRLGQLLPLCALVALLNPVFSPYGQTPLFWLGGRPYTREALLYGLALAAMAAAMLLWFGCWNAIFTADKLTALLGGLFPAFSLLLVQVFRLAPLYQRRARAILAARQGIGKAPASAPWGRRLQSGGAGLAALTAWALESGLVTADAMRSRGYGSGPRTRFVPTPFTRRDGLLTAALLVCLTGVGVCAAGGGFSASYLPLGRFAAPGPGLWFYVAFLLLPAALDLWEKLVWHISHFKM